MRIELVRPADLTPELLDRWIEIQRSQPWLHDPFARPEFALAVASVRGDVEVAVLEESGEVVGFFPFHRSRWNTGRPLGTKLSDCHLVPVRADVTWNPLEVVRKCRLSSWEFHLVPGEQRELLPYATEIHEAVYMDLSEGFTRYVERRNRTGAKKQKEWERLLRKAERRGSPVRFVCNSSDPAALDALLTWKSAQYRRTGATDILSFRWTNDLVRQAPLWTNEGFGSLLSAMYIGDQLAAVELGLRSHDVLHGWFSAYNRDLAEFAPGILLFTALAQTMADLGIARVHMGRNNLPYKSAFASDRFPVMAGSVAVATTAKILRASRQNLVRWSRSPWMAVPARIAKQAVNPLRTWMAFR